MFPSEILNARLCRSISNVQIFPLLKPLSHQGGVLAAFYKNAERQGENRENSMDTVAGTPLNAVGNPRTPRVGVSFGHAQNKRHHSAF